MTSSCHRIKVYSVNKTRPKTARRLAELEKYGRGLEPISLPLPFEQEPDDEYEAETARMRGRDPLE